MGPLNADDIELQPHEAWGDFFDLLATGGVPDDFLADRDDQPSQVREEFLTGLD